MTKISPPGGSVGKGILTSLLFQAIALLVAGGVAGGGYVQHAEPHRQKLIGMLLAGLWGFLSWAMVVPMARRWKRKGESRTVGGLYGMSVPVGLIGLLFATVAVWQALDISDHVWPFLLATVAVWRALGIPDYVWPFLLLPAVAVIYLLTIHLVTRTNRDSRIKGVAASFLLQIAVLGVVGVVIGERAILSSHFGVRFGIELTGVILAGLYESVLLAMTLHIGKICERRGEKRTVAGLYAMSIIAAVPGGIVGLLAVMAAAVEWLNIT